MKGACKSRTAEHSTRIGNSVDGRISYSDIVLPLALQHRRSGRAQFLDFAGLQALIECLAVIFAILCALVHIFGRGFFISPGDPVLTP